jgi:hypothetical protein
MSTDRSFWTTLPGIITALAGLMTAIAAILGLVSREVGGSSQPSSSRAAWAKEVNPLCKEILDETDRTMAQVREAETAWGEGNLGPLLKIAEIHLPRLVKAHGDFETHVNEIEAPPGEEHAIDEMLSASSKLALTFGKLEGIIKRLYDLSEAVSTFTTRSQQDLFQPAHDEKTPADLNEAVRLLSEAARLEAELKVEAESVDNEAVFRKNAEELGASECARLRHFEILEPGSG